jgi:hypothetical protein
MKCHIDFIVNEVGVLESYTVIEITFASFVTYGENLFQ